MLRAGVLTGVLTGVACGVDNDSRQRKLVVVVGQSNALGQQRTNNLTVPPLDIGNPYPNVRNWQKTAQAFANPPTWTINVSGAPLAAQTGTVANNTGQTTNLMGPSLTLGRYLDGFLPGGIDVAVFGVSATNIAVHWLPTGTYPASQPNLHTQSITYINDILLATGDQLGAIVWVQGETDAQNATHAGAYQTNLQAVFNAYRAAFPGVPIIFNRLSSSCIAANTAAVRTAQAAVQAATSNCTMVDVDTLTLTDGYHFSADAYADLGRSLGAAVRAAGVTP